MFLIRGRRIQWEPDEWNWGYAGTREVAEAGALYLNQMYKWLLQSNAKLHRAERRWSKLSMNYDLDEEAREAARQMWHRAFNALYIARDFEPLWQLDPAWRIHRPCRIEYSVVELQPAITRIGDVLQVAAEPYYSPF